MPDIIKNITISGIGQEGNAIRINSMVTTADLGTLTSPGFLNDSNLPAAVLPTDLFIVKYNWDDNTQTGSFNAFSVSISPSGIITLY